jgi:hypothetical protein
MKRLVLFLVVFAFLGSGCNNNPRAKDSKAELLKIQNQMQAQQEMIKKLGLPSGPNAIKAPPAFNAPIKNIPKAPASPKGLNKKNLQNPPLPVQGTNGQ